MDQAIIWLVVADGPNEGDVVPVSQNEFLIGRRADCHFRPRGDGVADLHCAVLDRNGRFFLRNFHRPGGTSVGGRQVLGGIELRDKDCFRVGEWQLQVRITGRTCKDAVMAPAEPDAVLASAQCGVAWSAAPPAGTAQFFVVCSNAAPNAPAPGVPEPMSAPETVAETLASADTVHLPVDAPKNGLAPADNANTDAADALGVQMQAPPAVKEAGSDTTRADGTGEETVYLPLTALEPPSSTATPVAGVVPVALEHQERRPSRSSALGKRRSEKAEQATEQTPPRPVILVGRLDRAMPMLRQQGWEAATRPKVPVSATLPPRGRKRWLPAVGGVVLGMALVGVFYLAASRASSAVPARMPPRGRLHTGIEILHHAAPGAAGPGEQTRPPRSDGSRPPPRGLPRGGGPRR